MTKEYRDDRGKWFEKTNVLGKYPEKTSTARRKVTMQRDQKSVELERKDAD